MIAISKRIWLYCDNAIKCHVPGLQIRFSSWYSATLLLYETVMNFLTSNLLSFQTSKRCFVVPLWNSVTQFGEILMVYKISTYVLYEIFILRRVKFIYLEKAANFCEISTVDLFYVVAVKSTVAGDFAKFCGLLRIYEL